eukprot:8209705-Pyramimonas_sp.AAC.1
MIIITSHEQFSSCGCDGLGLLYSGGPSSAPARRQNRGSLPVSPAPPPAPPAAALPGESERRGTA